MKENLNWFDTSDYPANNVFNMPRVNKKEPGLFKDELNSRLMIEFVGLRSKMYCVRSIDVNNRSGGMIDAMKKAKGVRKYVLRKEISFEDYFNCIQNNCIITKHQNSFRAKLHKVYSIRQKKTASSPFDNKRIVLSDNIHTLPYGYRGVRMQ